MTDLGDSKEDAESFVNDVKKVAEKTTVSGLLLYTLFQERLLEKVNVAIPKGIVGGFEFTVLQRSLKE